MNRNKTGYYGSWVDQEIVPFEEFQKRVPGQHLDVQKARYRQYKLSWSIYHQPEESKTA